MTKVEREYWNGEFSNDELNKLAEAGERLLELEDNLICRLCGERCPQKRQGRTI